jgi:peptide/nickel transport system permease protein
VTELPTTPLSPALPLGATPEEIVASRRPWSLALRRAGRDPAVVIGASGLFLVLFLAAFGPVIWATDPTLVHLDQALKAPSLAHPMGTDAVGRDIFSRFNAGARTSILIGLLAVTTGATIGTLIGLLTGAIGGIFDAVAMRINDVLLAFPPIILAIAVTIGLGAGVWGPVVGIVLTSIPFYARVIRSEVLRVRTLAFTEAVRALGGSRRRIMLRHVFPNSITTLPIIASSNFSYAILTLAALGFIGLGIKPPKPEWGSMITDGQQYILTGQWWIVIFPGIGLLLLTTTMGILADSLRDYLDPRGVPA